MKILLFAVLTIALWQCVAAFTPHCAVNCDDDSGPVCASNGQVVRSFSNLCELGKYNCEYRSRYEVIDMDACRHNEDLQLIPHDMQMCIDLSKQYITLNGLPSHTNNFLLCKHAQAYAEKIAGDPKYLHSIQHQTLSVFGYGSIQAHFESNTHYIKVILMDTENIGIGYARYKHSLLEGIDTESSQESPSVDETWSVFETECLNAHNSYRSLHGVPSLTLNRELCNVAQSYAEYLAQLGSLQHSGNGYGENLYWAYNINVNGQTAVTSWYSEIVYFNFNAPAWTPGAGHFTQVVWRNSRDLGVGVARVGAETYVVCNYNPPGNYLNQFAENVPPPL